MGSVLAWSETDGAKLGFPFNFWLPWLLIAAMLLAVLSAASVLHNRLDNKKD